MLVLFSVKNFKTFKDKAVLNLVASNYEKSEDLEGEPLHTDSQFNLKILKSAVVYGANASGKTKLVEALGFMKRFVLDNHSVKGQPIPVTPFRLNTETESAPSEFEVAFIHNKVLYRYGFEADSERICAEWLYYRPKTKEIELFYRELQEFETHARNFPKGNLVIKQELVAENALLLAVAAQFNDDICNQVMEWFGTLKVISGANEERYKAYTMKQTQIPDRKRKILELLNAADLGIEDVQLKKMNADQLPPDLRDIIFQKMANAGSEAMSGVETTHKKRDSSGQFVEHVQFSMEEDESNGTEKFYILAGPILDVLENGYTLVVDELDAKLHSNLVARLVSLFHSNALNPKNAQLIFNTHDTNLLSADLFRRDQIWFTEKNRYGEAELFSLADFKSADGVRKNEAYEKNYLRGKYGAVPFLGSFRYLTELVSSDNRID
ncbi:MAG TPA: ATP-binding protein [Saprospiraceae bacterium]|nr:ATP-binding protein [Saprospiraceae bacterium]HMQ82018.1 ATP-binding protein [Saprospiraceae bacterium]